MLDKIKIRLLNEHDYLDWKAIRLEMLEKEPTFLGASYQEAVLKSDELFKSDITKQDNYIFGAFLNKDLIGVAGLNISNSEKIKHKGRVWSLYVKYNYRGKSIASKLIEMIISFANSRVIYLDLPCQTNNFSAYKLYKKFNFKVIAIDQHSIKYEGKFYDDYIMRLYLNNDLNQL